MARSSTKAKYKAVTNASSQLIWINSLLCELCILLPAAILWCDNIGATNLSANPVFHARMKHIKVDFHFVREQAAARQLRVCVISSQDQTADLLTKALPRQLFLQLFLTGVSLAGRCLRTNTCPAITFRQLDCYNHLDNYYHLASSDLGLHSSFTI